MLIEFCGDRSQFRRRQTYGVPFVPAGESGVIEFAVDDKDRMIAEVKNEEIVQHLLSIPHYWEAGSARANAQKAEIAESKKRLAALEAAELAELPVGAQGMDAPPPTEPVSSDFGKGYKPKRARV